MTPHGRALRTFLLMVCTAALTGGCSTVDSRLLEKQTREVSVLQQQLADKDRALESLQNEFQELEKWARELALAEAANAGCWDNPNALLDLRGKVISVSGKLCTVVVDGNPGNVDVQAVIDRMPFRLQILDENGYKAEVFASKYEAAANAVLCRLMFTKGDATIVIGDKASTHQ